MATQSKASTCSDRIESNGVLQDVRQLSETLNCSTRHIYRLVDSGKMPKPVRLGSLVRWPRAVIEEWIAAEKMR